MKQKRWCATGSGPLWLIVAGLSLAGCPEAGGGAGTDKVDAAPSGEGNQDASLDSTTIPTGGSITSADAAPGGAGGEGGGGTTGGSTGGSTGGTGGETGGTGGVNPKPDAGLGGEMPGPDAAAGGAILPPDAGGGGMILPPDAGMDDCIDGTVEACAPDLCFGGSRTCVGGVWGPCRGPAETCDGVDNDCNGAVDDGFPDLGQACTSGFGVCEVLGVVICAPRGDGTTCSAQADVSVDDEVCNGLDDDCDGFTDEDRNDDPLIESCYEGPAGTEGIGACTLGTSTCIDGRFGACVGSGTPSPEVCNDRDDDCNGATDDNGGGGLLEAACYSGPAGTEGIAGCHGGTSVCRNGVPGPCEGEQLPGREICDTQDNDCNGAIDEVAGGCGCMPGAQQPCYAGPAGTEGVGICRPGNQTCMADGSGFGACQGQVLPGVEVCDALDNDCDGRLNDGIRGAGTPCQLGQGVCAAAGTQVCDAASGELICDALPGEPRPEVCDGLDNNCDGAADEGFALGERCVGGIGACQAGGSVVCDGEGGTRCDAPIILPQREVCDGVDNDCNEVVDGDGLCPEGLACIQGACLPFAVDPCNTYRELGEPDRHVSVNSNESGQVICDVDGWVPGWHRFVGEAGSLMPTSPPAELSCGTHAPGWLDGAYPSPAEGEVDRRVCFNWAGNPCNWESPVQVKNCGGFFVFNLPAAPVCSLRYCGEGPAVGDLRLVGGASENEGRVEVFFNDAWGTICDDGWEDGGATGFQGGDVICRQLGYRGAQAVDHLELAGEGSIWLDDVTCAGNEPSIADCPASPVGQHNCGHNEDVSVRCLMGEGVAGDACRVDGHCVEGLLCADGLCREPPRCGDRNVDPGETCDDGNRNPGDGCSADCIIEVPPVGGLVPGVQQNVSPAALANRGWRQCYRDLYNNGGTPLAQILGGCEGEQLFMGCRAVGQANFLVGAEGAFAEVTRDVGNGNAAVNTHNGVDFYYSTGWSWGFAPAGAGVNRNSCDVLNTDAERRMCWHTGGGNINAGWRCGANTGLGGDAAWERVVYTRDANAVPVRPVLMHCGDSGRPVASFVDPGDGLDVVAGCNPDANTQALIVPRGGEQNIAANAAAWRAYVQAGGLIITEFNVADNVYNAIFQANVVEGAFTGSCQDNINPPTRFNLADPFWVDNAALPVQPANSSGCGRNMQGWNQPIVRLGGWDANTTSLAYRDLNLGRVWLVESDWQDAQAEFTAESRRLMRYMIFHGRRAGQALGLNRAFGHHGSCDTFNACNDARTCANAACNLLTGSPATSWQEGRCQDLAASLPGGIDCDLFSALPDQLDAQWGNGCNIPVVYDVTCGVTPEANPSCANNPLWRRVECDVNSWVWSNDRAGSRDFATAEANRELYTGCTHSGDGNNDALCSLDGTGYVSTQRWNMASCDASWLHLAPDQVFDCGGHDGDVVRRLVSNANGCYDYRALPPPGPAAP